MAKQFKYLEKALEAAFKDRHQNPKSRRIKAVIELAEIEHSSIKLAGKLIDMCSAKADKLVRKSPFLMEFVIGAHADRDARCRTRDEALVELNLLIERAIRAEDSDW